MFNREIIRVQDGEWQGLVYLDSHGLGYGQNKLPLGKPTAAEYAELCDLHAENANRHDFVGTHKALLDLMNEILSTNKVHIVFRELAEHGGLQHLGDET